MLEDKLRDEIIEAQKAQAQLAKWKLLSIAGLVAAGVGAVPGVEKLDRPITFALIPLVCVYVDVLGFSTSVRVMKIARYFRIRYERTLAANYLSDTPTAAAFDDYELYCNHPRRHANIETMAMLAVTFLASLAVIAVGTWKQPLIMLAAEFRSDLTPVMLRSSGAVGVAATAIFYIYHVFEMNRLQRNERLERSDEITALRRSLDQIAPGWTQRCDATEDVLALDERLISTTNGDLRLLGQAIRYAELQGKRMVWSWNTAPPDGGAQGTPPVAGAPPLPLLADAPAASSTFVPAENVRDTAKHATSPSLLHPNARLEIRAR